MKRLGVKGEEGLICRGLNMIGYRVMGGLWVRIFPTS